MSKQFTTKEYQQWHDAQPKKMVVVKCLLRSTEGNVLIAKPTYKPTWQLPGGGVDAGESPETALVREIHEELGIQISSRDMKIIGVIHKADDDTLFLIYEYVKTISESETFTLPADELKTYEFVQYDVLASRLPSHYEKFLSTK